MGEPLQVVPGDFACQAQSKLNFLRALLGSVIGGATGSPIGHIGGVDWVVKDTYAEPVVIEADMMKVQTRPIGKFVSFTRNKELEFRRPIGRTPEDNQIFLNRLREYADQGIPYGAKFLYDDDGHYCSETIAEGSRGTAFDLYTYETRTVWLNYNDFFVKVYLSIAHGIHSPDDIPRGWVMIRPDVICNCSGTELVPGSPVIEERMLEGSGDFLYNTLPGVDPEGKFAFLKALWGGNILYSEYDTLVTQTGHTNWFFRYFEGEWMDSKPHSVTLFGKHAEERELMQKIADWRRNTFLDFISEKWGYEVSAEAFMERMKDDPLIKALENSPSRDLSFEEIMRFTIGSYTSSS